MKYVLWLIVFIMAANVVAADNVTNVDVGIIADGDADVSVDCSASGSCKYNIGGNSFEKLDAKWSSDSKGIGRYDVSELMIEGVGCLLGYDRLLGERVDCNSRPVALIATVLDAMVKGYIDPFVRRQQTSLQVQDEIIARQNEIIARNGLWVNESQVELDAAWLTYTRTKSVVHTRSGFACNMINDKFTCIRSEKGD